MVGLSRVRGLSSLSFSVGRPVGRPVCIGDGLLFRSRWLNERRDQTNPKTLVKADIRKSRHTSASRRETPESSTSASPPGLLLIKTRLGVLVIKYQRSWERVYPNLFTPLRKTLMLLIHQKGNSTNHGIFGEMCLRLVVQREHVQVQVHILQRAYISSHASLNSLEILNVYGVRPIPAATFPIPSCPRTSQATIK